MPFQTRSKIKILRAAWLILAAFLIPSIAAAQNPACSLKLDQLPDAQELRGFHLGMTREQVKTRIPQVAFDPADQFGVTKISISPLFERGFDRTSFADIRTVSLDFLDGKLVTLWIGFESTFKWRTLDEFVAGFSKSLTLPGRWPPKRAGRELTCDGFSVFASMIGGGPSIRLTDDSAQEMIANRREAAAEAADRLVVADTVKKLYYTSDCAGRENIESSNRATFKDKDEAEKAGYKLAKDCQ
jgi:hypothetical protein